MKKPAINLGNREKTKNNNQWLTTFVDPDDQPNDEQLCGSNLVNGVKGKKQLSLLVKKL